MAFTKIAAAGIGSTGTVTLQNVVITGNLNAPSITGAASTANVRANSLVVSGVTTSSGGFVGNVTGNSTGLSGTPNITVGVLTATNATFSGNVSVAGTVTYEDVTNVDSVGVITARSGVRINAGGLVVTSGVSTFSGHPVLIGSATSTGTSTQPLQVTGGAYVSSNTGIGTTRPTSRLQVVGDVSVSGVVTAFDFYNDAEYPSVRPTLDLAFAQTKILDSRITFTRSSTATYVNYAGIITTAAANEPRFDHDPATGESLGLLVEEARTNDLTYSQYFTGANWDVKTNINVLPNAGLAPDGTYTATNVVPTTTNSYHQISLYSPHGSASSVSVFVKANGYNRIALIQNGFQNNGLYEFDLSAGTAASAISSITSHPNGWYRVAVRFPNTLNRFDIYFYNNSNQSSFAGDGSSGVLVWGAQWETGSFPTSYIPTPATFTSRASTATYYDASGVIQTAGSGVARSAAFFPDSNGTMQSAGLLLEEARTNGDTDSATLSVSWSVANGTFANATLTAPDNSSTVKLLTENTSAGEHYIGRFYDNTYTGHALSVYVKPNGRTRIRMSLDTTAGGLNVDFNLSTLTITGGPDRAGYIERLPSGWYRITGVAIGGYRGYCQIMLLDNSGASSYTGNGTSGIYLWGVQYEKAVSYSSSYIPTSGSTVTRAADVSSSATVTRSADVASITGANFSSWYNQSEGTICCYVITRCPLGGGASTSNIGISFALLDTAGSNYILGTRTEEGSAQGNNFKAFIYSSGATVLNAGVTNSWLPNVLSRQSIAYKVNDFNFSVNGTLGTPVTTGAVPININRLDFGQMSYATYNRIKAGTFARLTYWPIRLSNNVLQTITL